MKKNILLITIIIVLVFISCNKTKDLNNEETVFETFQEEVIEAQAIKAETAEDQDLTDENHEEQGESSFLSELPIDYSEVNKMIDNIIIQKIISVVQFIGKYLLIAWSFFLSWPSWLKAIIYIAMFPAAIAIVYSHVLAIYMNRNEWQKHPDHHLMYSYFINSGNLQRRKSYDKAHILVFDKKWLIFSLAGLAYRLGNYTNKSAIIMFLLSFSYIPLSILGFIEMVLRGIFGSIWLFIFNILHKFFLFITRLITMLLIPISKLADRLLLKTQYCQQCYKTIVLPDFICPSCNRVHKNLIPGRCGVLFVRCSCNKTFLPCTVFTGRSRLAAKCNDCETELAVANAKHFSITIIGGNDSGKTAYIAAFTNLYRNKINNTKRLTIKGKPEEAFKKLEDFYNNGVTESDTEPCTYSLVHKHRKSVKDNLVFYDTMDESIVSESYPRSPKYFGYCDGIILIIDPLSKESVRNEVAETGNAKDLEEYSTDDIDSLVSQFVRLYFGIRGYSTGILCEIPLAVLINKTDIDVIKREIGLESNNEEYDQDHACKEYMVKIGLSNLLNNIEATFAKVKFFSVSAIGHTAQNGKSFNPIGVTAPVAWIAKERGSRLLKNLTNIKD